MVEPGAIVMVKQTATQLWCVKAPAPGGDWYLAGDGRD